MKILQRMREMASVKDDRGRFVEVDPRSRGNARLNARSREQDAGTHRTLTVFGNVAVVVAAICLASFMLFIVSATAYALFRVLTTPNGRMQLALFIVMFAAIFAFFGGPLQYIALVQGAERRKRTRIAASRLLKTFCGGCEYDLSNTVASEDGCTVCAECGAAWRIDLWKRDWERRDEWRTHRAPAKQRVHLFDIFASHLMVHRTRPERRRMFLRSFCTSTLVPGRFDVVLIVSVLLTILIAIYMGNVEPSFLWTTLKPIVPIALFAAVFLRVMWAITTASHRPATKVLQAGSCPHCEHPLRPQPAHGDGAALCEHCGAAWSKALYDAVQKRVVGGSSKGESRGAAQ